MGIHGFRPLSGRCYACDAPATGTRDRRPEGGELEPACDRHREGVHIDLGILRSSLAKCLERTDHLVARTRELGESLAALRADLAVVVHLIDSGMPDGPPTAR